MTIKASLFFRECIIYEDKEGNCKLRVRFLDENDKEYTFFFDDNKENEKYKTMKKDTIVDLKLILYVPSNKNGRYSLYCG